MRPDVANSSNVKLHPVRQAVLTAVGRIAPNVEVSRAPGFNGSVAIVVHRSRIGELAFEEYIKLRFLSRFFDKGFVIAAFGERLFVIDENLMVDIVFCPSFIKMRVGFFSIEWVADLAVESGRTFTGDHTEDGSLGAVADETRLVLNNDLRAEAHRRFESLLGIARVSRDDEDATPASEHDPIL